MIHFNVFNYSKLGDKEIEGRINSFFKYLKGKGIEGDFKIEVCGEPLKNRFRKYTEDETDIPLIDNPGFVLEIDSYIKETSKHNNAKEYRFVFIGEHLNTQYEWGDAFENWSAVIKKSDEKAIWHELAHLINANDHYDEKTHKPLSNCTNPAHCIMTYGKLVGELCSESLEEIRKYTSSNHHSLN